jgi:hypothetical protein
MWKLYFFAGLHTEHHWRCYKKTLLVLCIVIDNTRETSCWLTDDWLTQPFYLQALCFGDYLHNGNFAWACELADLCQVVSGDIGNTQDPNKQSFSFFVM